MLLLVEPSMKLGKAASFYERHGYAIDERHGRNGNDERFLSCMIILHEMNDAGEIPSHGANFEPNCTLPLESSACGCFMHPSNNPSERHLHPLPRICKSATPRSFANRLLPFIHGFART